MIARTYGPRLSDEYNDDEFGDVGPPPANWKEMITAPLEMNCLAPSDEAIGLAYDLFCEELFAPFQAREADMAALYADVLGGVGDLQLLAPDLLEEVLSSDQDMPENGRAA